MMTRTRLAMLAVSLTTLVLAACSGSEVGRVCFLGEDQAGSSNVVVASPALECQSRTCLHLPAGSGNDLCTAECESDDDCDKVPESPCKSGFTCAVPIAVGPFCCKKLCVCSDDLEANMIDPDAQLEACNADNPINQCCNLDGRRGNADYPQCG